MELIQKVIIDGVERTIEYLNCKVGDLVYDKNSERTYIADLWDADEARWIVVNNKDE